jgi:hypothetical protein
MTKDFKIFIVGLFTTLWMFAFFLIGNGELNRSALCGDIQPRGGLPFIRQRRSHFKDGVVHSGRKSRDKIQISFHQGYGVDDRGTGGNRSHHPPAPKHGAQPE